MTAICDRTELHAGRVISGRRDGFHWRVLPGRNGGPDVQRSRTWPDTTWLGIGFYHCDCLIDTSCMLAEELLGEQSFYPLERSRSLSASYSLWKEVAQMGREEINDRLRTAGWRSVVKDLRQRSDTEQGMLGIDELTERISRAAYGRRRYSA